MTANEVKVGVGATLLVAGSGLLYLVMTVWQFCGLGFRDFTDADPGLICYLPEGYIIPSIMLAAGAVLVVIGLWHRKLLPKTT